MGGIDWMVVGGESGKNARPLNLAWVYSAVLQCKESGVAVFVKQLGSCPYHTFFKEELCEMTARLKLNDRKGGDPSEWPPDLRVREFPPTKAQGRSD